MASLGGKQLNQFRVVDLRTELEKRGLDKSGLKGALVERLEKSLLDYSAELNGCVFSTEQGNEAKKTSEAEATQTPNSNLETINKQSLQTKTAGKLLEQSIEINTATKETNCKETMTEFNPVPTRSSKLEYSIAELITSKIV
ncbi:SAFB-like transcription modulator isoform X1 [Paramuricea clavata]|uniref:SAFB-like transcription modulator isoform X1 n=1 Tax=Paramuricea clavata TaxID=317549 RepID=A0A7D9EIS2_PARCT|nr:SAFB-like transcription modulator isoform X1 [Paramuricea clavata]